MNLGLPFHPHDDYENEDDQEERQGGQDETEIANSSQQD
jgi:hypothetical protein